MSKLSKQNLLLYKYVWAQSHKCVIAHFKFNIQLFILRNTTQTLFIKKSKRVMWLWCISSWRCLEVSVAAGVSPSNHTDLENIRPAGNNKKRLQPHVSTAVPGLSEESSSSLCIYMLCGVYYLLNSFLFWNNTLSHLAIVRLVYLKCSILLACLHLKCKVDLQHLE